ncbi:MAG TPA: inositol monophosphatase family protein [Bacteroidales bacterium]|nr:inositol monophosphatase family protein [Bacteroidales bacterium]
MLAEGSADEYLRFGRTMEWDIAAGDAILCYAVGKIRNVENSKPLKYNKKNLANPEFIAYRVNHVIGL